MKTSRRDFVKTSALVAFGAALLPAPACSSDKKRHVGIQLYSIRDAMPKDPLG